MDVYAGRVYARHIEVVRIHTNDLTHAEQKVLAPRLPYHVLGRERGELGVVCGVEVGGVETARAVLIRPDVLAYAVRRFRAVTRVLHYEAYLLFGELVEEGLPLLVRRVVVVSGIGEVEHELVVVFESHAAAREVVAARRGAVLAHDEFILYARVLFKLGHLGVHIVIAVVSYRLCLDCRSVLAGKFGITGSPDAALPVLARVRAARKVRPARAERRTVGGKPEVCRIPREAVGYIRAAYGIGGIRYVLGHAVGKLAAACKSVADYVRLGRVSVRHEAERIAPRVKLPRRIAVGVLVIAVIGRKVVCGESKRHDGAFTRCEFGRLCEIHKGYYGLFHFVVVIGRSEVELYYVLARICIARVGHAHLNGDFRVLIESGAAIKRHFRHFPRKVGV